MVVALREKEAMMTKHIADQDRTRGQARLRHFLRQEREDMPHSATLSLQARPKARDDRTRKPVEYSRIERGQKA